MYTVFTRQLCSLKIQPHFHSGSNSWLPFLKKDLEKNFIDLKTTLLFLSESTLDLASPKRTSTKSTVLRY